MVPLCIPDSEEQLAVIKSLLDMAGIEYMVRNEHFGAMIPGSIFAACGPRDVLVAPDHLENARRLLTPHSKQRPRRRAVRSDSRARRGIGPSFLRSL
jgi:hypothetical protein